MAVVRMWLALVLLPALLYIDTDTAFLKQKVSTHATPRQAAPWNTPQSGNVHAAVTRVSVHLHKAARAGLEFPEHSIKSCKQLEAFRRAVGIHALLTCKNIFFVHCFCLSSVDDEVFTSANFSCIAFLKAKLECTVSVSDGSKLHLCSEEEGGNWTPNVLPHSIALKAGWLLVQLWTLVR